MSDKIKYQDESTSHVTAEKNREKRRCGGSGLSAFCQSRPAIRKEMQVWRQRRAEKCSKKTTNCVLTEKVPAVQGANKI